VIDCSKHLRRVLDRRPGQARQVTVEPGLVLDHLNAQLKPHGLWYPVDVSTSAQATLGGMAGNNSCGSRSIAYGNMVHNVAGARAWTGRRQPARLRPDGADATGRAAGDRPVRARPGPDSTAPEIDARWPKVLRRVAGYNLDIFHRRASALHRRRQRQPGAPAGGQRRHAGLHPKPDAALSELPRAKVLGIVNFNELPPRPWRRRSTSSSWAPRRVELVDRTMIELALPTRPSADDAHRADRPRPEAILLVEFCRRRPRPHAAA
jgi:hypothetical protein